MLCSIPFLNIDKTEDMNKEKTFVSYSLTADGASSDFQHLHGHDTKKYNLSMTTIVALILFVFGIIASFGVILDTYPTWEKASGMIDKEREVAQGIYDSSTCMFYRNELTLEETERWESSAKAEGDAKCVHAKITLNTNPLIMKVHHFVYQYIPWAPGNAKQTFKDVFLYLSGCTPILFFLFRMVANWYSVNPTGAFPSYQKDTLA